MEYLYLVSVLNFVTLLVWMSITSKHAKHQQQFAVFCIYFGLIGCIINHADPIIVMPFGFTAGFLAIINHYYKGFII